jgi:hypothetical protein
LVYRHDLEEHGLEVIYDVCPMDRLTECESTTFDSSSSDRSGAVDEESDKSGSADEEKFGRVHRCLKEVGS